MRHIINRFLVSAVSITVAGAAMATQASNTISAGQRALDMMEVQNVASRYSDYYFENNFDAVANLFALNEPDVSYHTPMGPTGGTAIKAEFARRKMLFETGKDPVGQMHIHPMTTQIVEVAGDGKTAKGLFDSFGADVGSAEDVGNWLYLRKCIDFIKEDGSWKIWHMQDYPVFNTPYDKSWTQSAKEGFNERRGPPPGAAGAAAGAPPAEAPPPGPTKKLWIYDGKTVQPQNEPRVPEPYQTFNPKDAC